MARTEAIEKRLTLVFQKEAAIAVQHIREWHGGNTDSKAINAALIEFSKLIALNSDIEECKKAMKILALCKDAEIHGKKLCFAEKKDGKYEIKEIIHFL